MVQPERHARHPEGRTRRLEVTAVRDASAFRDAHAHGWLVRILRWTLPAVVVAAGSAFVLSVVLAPERGNSLALGEVDVKSDALIMQNPHVSGYSGVHQSYELSADRAIQSLSNPKVVRLENIDAKLGMPNEATAKVGAKAGIYDSQAETLQLLDGIKVKTTDGYEASLSQANVDLKNGNLQSSQPVELRSADGMIRGNSVEITEGGKRIVFRNGVSVTFVPSPDATAGGANKEPAPR